MVVTPVMGPLAYGSGLNILQILAYVLVAVASLPVARVVLVGRSPDESGLHAHRAALSDPRTFSLGLSGPNAVRPMYPQASHEVPVDCLYGSRVNADQPMSSPSGKTARSRST